MSLRKNNKKSIIREGYNPEEHYFENGFMVFTEAYHTKRGYCCKNNCRHCPYGFKKSS